MTVSKEVLGKYLQPGDVFVETGTRWGDTAIHAIELGAKQVWTSEIDPLMAAIAELHIADHAHGTPFAVHRGPSAGALMGLNWIDAYAAVVFLDAHDVFHSPVMEELQTIESWEGHPRVIMIDDISCMLVTWRVAPEELVKKLQSMGYETSFEKGARPDDILVGVRK